VLVDKLLDRESTKWRKLNNEELHNFNSSPNVITVIKLTMMRGPGHVALMGR